MTEPKILIFDLETAGVNALKPDLSSIVNFGYKFVGEPEAHVLTIDQFPKWFSRNGLNDKPLLKAGLDIMAQADICVAHFGTYFDQPYLYGRCIINGLEPPAPAKLRDTWFIARKNFNFSGNRLAHLADILGVDQKKMRKDCPEHWPGWWLKAMAGNKTAIHEMAEYCAQDVQALEQVYLKLRPYDKAHPVLIHNRDVCGLCGGKVQYRGFEFAKMHKYRRFQCVSCGHWGRDSKKAD